MGVDRDDRVQFTRYCKSKGRVSTVTPNPWRRSSCRALIYVGRCGAWCGDRRQVSPFAGSTYRRLSWKPQLPLSFPGFIPEFIPEGSCHRTMGRSFLKPLICQYWALEWYKDVCNNMGGKNEQYKPQKVGNWCRVANF